MQLSSIEQLYTRAEKAKEESTLFLLNSKGPVLFPMVINSHLQVSKKRKKLNDLSFYFEIYIDVEHLYSFNYVYMRKNNYHSFLSPSLYIGCEPLYEYGNEESHLPRIDDFSTVWSLHAIEELVKDNIKQAFTDYYPEQTQLEHILHTFSDIWKDYDSKMNEKNSINEDDYNYTLQEKEYIDYFFKKLRHYEKNDQYFQEQIINNA